MPWTPPSSAEPFVIRPLDKGVRLDGSTLTVPDGSMLQSDNFIANLEGHRRRPGYGVFGGSAVVPDRPVDVISTRDSDGVEVTLLLTLETLFLVNARTGYTEVPWAYSTGTVTVAGDTITGAGTDWVTAGILPGDIIRVGSQEAKVLSRSSGTVLLINAGDIDDGTALSYSIQRTFSPGRLNAPQWVKTPDGVAIADGKHELLMYDVTANTIVYWITDAGKRPPLGATIPAVVGYDGARVFQGNLSDSDGDHASMLQWSGLADNHDFNFAENWQDFPQFTGSLLRVLSLQDKVMLYFTDGVKSGAPTNYPTAPYRYVSLETGPLGLVGSYAVTPYLGGHFFISQNGFYFTNGSSYEDISVPISRAIQQISVSPEWSYVCPDPLNYSVMFGIPEDGTKITQIWRLDPRSKSWSRDLIDTQMIANPIVNSAISWDDITGTAWEDLSAMYPTWDAFRVRDTQRRVILEYGGRLYRGTANDGVDFGTVGIAATLMTKDYDFSAGDTSKAFTRFGVKLTSDGVRTAPIVFAIYGSQNRGRNWKFLGNMTIPVDRDEGYVNFGMLGSTIRFRLETSSMDTSYFIIEHGIYVRGSGNELGTALHA